MEFELGGAHCHYKLCRQHTYLPVKCISCKHQFCKSHIDFASHQCLDSSKQNKTDVKGDPGFCINAGKSCSYSKCTKVTLVTILCQQCNKLFCVSHRHVDTHKCGKDLGIKNIDGCRLKKKKKKKKKEKKTKTTDIENVQCQNERKEENSLSNNKWKCLECSTMNESDRNVIPCAKCQILNSETNLYRSRCLYLLGNIAKPIPRLLPLKTPFFIYPLAPPMVTITKQVINEGVWIHFEIDYLYDFKGIEMYHIEKVKFEMWKLDNIDIKGTRTYTKYLDFVIKNLTPYYNVFTKFFKKPYFGKFRVDIKAKCYGSNLVSPTKIIKFDLLPPKTPTMTSNRKKRQFNEIVDNKKQDLLIKNYKKQRINGTKKHSNQNRKQQKTPKIDDDEKSFDDDDELKLALAMSMEPSDDDNDNNNNKNKNNKNNIRNLFYKPLSKKIQKQNKAKKRKTAENGEIGEIGAIIAYYRKMMVKGCGEPRCTNPYCKSNWNNRDKTYSAQQVSVGAITLKIMKSEIKKCSQFKKSNMIKDKKKRIEKQERKKRPKNKSNNYNLQTFLKLSQSQKKCG